MKNAPLPFLDRFRFQLLALLVIVALAGSLAMWFTRGLDR